MELVHNLVDLDMDADDETLCNLLICHVAVFTLLAFPFSTRIACSR